MANYQELLSKAVLALPENNGASRREVYEKARKALVAQLRSISPPLPAREITQHRLELEDCIRQVEHDATEALIGGLKELDEDPIPLVTEELPKAPPAPETKAIEVPEAKAASLAVEEPVTAKEAVPDKAVPEKAAPEAEAKPADAKSAEPETETKLVAAEVAKDKTPAVTSAAETEKKADKAPTPSVLEEAKKASSEQPEKDADSTSIDAIIARAEAAREKTAKETEAKEIAAKAEAAKEIAEKEALAVETAAREVASKLAAERDAVAKAEAAEQISVLEAIGEAEEKSKPLAAKAAETNAPSDAVKSPGATTVSDAAVGAAMSRVREVEVDAPPPVAQPIISDPGGNSSQTNSKNGAVRTNAPVAAPVDASVDDPEGGDAQLAVDRAIRTLDREARGEHETEEDMGQSLEDALGANRQLTSGEARFSSGGEDEKSGSALTIFLVLAIVLLGVVGGGGYWAWREGYIPLEALFASGDVLVADQEAPTPENTSEPQTDDSSVRNVTPEGTNSGPGNTATDVESDAPSGELEVAPVDDKIDERLPSTDTGTTDPTATDLGADDKVDDRLSTDPQPELTTPGENTGEGNPGTLPNTAQSLLLEASADGTTGAVPFSGTVEWSRGVDELGQPTLTGVAKIPARNLGVKVLIRRNGDASLPASHLMEIDFDVSETFSGGSVAGLPGILLKNEELVQGAALVGASARVVGNSFLFALSAAEQDVRNNINLLETRKWMDLAIVYSTGRRAIITLEKDDAAQAMFTDVLAQWRAADAQSASSN